jgi:peptidoglycan hydrolase-like protein with peptidoglycan-binding domain
MVKASKIRARACQLVSVAVMLIGFGGNQALAQTNIFDVFKSIIDKAGPSQPQAPAPAPTPQPQATTQPVYTPPPMSAEQAAFVSLPTAQLSQLQTILQGLNFYKGTIDGQYGGQTAEAVRSWQRQKGFPATGWMDAPQITALLKDDAAAKEAKAPKETKEAKDTKDTKDTKQPAEAVTTAALKIDDDEAIFEVAPDGKPRGGADALIWRGGQDPKFVKPTFESAITPQTMRIKAGSNGADVVWVYDEGDFAMPFSSELCGAAAIDKKCTVEIALHDFDGDGRPEVVVVVGDGRTALKFWIVQYYRPSAPPTYKAKRDYWSILFEGDGEKEVDLQGGRIIVPRGNKGQFDEYAFQGKQFVKKN